MGYSGDTDAIRASETQHSVQGRGRDGNLRGFGPVRPGAERVADHALVVTGRRLHPGPKIVATGLLPVYPAPLGDILDVAVPL